MGVRLDGTVRLDGVTYSLLASRDGWAWSAGSATTPLQATTSEESVLATAETSYRRTCGWLDWSLGGVGPSAYQAPARWLSASAGPLTDQVRRITRAPARRRVSLAVSGNTYANGRVTDIFDGPVVTASLVSSRALYVMQSTGAIRRIVPTLNAETVTPIKALGSVNATTGAISGADADGVTLATRAADVPAGAPFGPTEASPPWTFTPYVGSPLGSATDTWVVVGRADYPIVVFDGVNWTQDVTESVIPPATIPGSYAYAVTVRNPTTGALESGVTVKLSTDTGASANLMTTTTNASGVATFSGVARGGWYLHLSKAGLTYNTPVAIVVGDGDVATGEPENVETPVYGSTQYVTRDAVWRTRFATGTYATGAYLWATTAPYYLDGVSLKASPVRATSLEAEQDPCYADYWVSNFGTATAPIDKVTANREAVANGIAVLRDAIIVATADGNVYRIATGGEFAGVAVPLLDARATVADPDTGKGMRVWRGKLYVPTARGLYQYDEFSGQVGGTWTSVGPEAIRGNDGPVRGPCVLYAGDPEWLYACFWNGTDTYVMRGRPNAEQGAPGPFAWHAVAPYLPGERATAVRVSNVGANPILVIGAESSTPVSDTDRAPALHFVTLPRPGYTWFTDPNCVPSSTADNPEPQTAYYADLPDHDALAPTVIKSFLAISVITTGASDASPVAVYYRVDRGGWTFASTVVGNPYTVIPLPANTVGHKLGVRLVWTGGDTTTWTQVEGVAFDFTPSVPRAPRVDCTLYIEEGQLSLSGISGRGAVSRIRALQRLDDDRATFQVIGPDGEAHLAQVDPQVGVRWRPVFDVQPGSQAGYTVTLRLNLYDDTVAYPGGRYDVDRFGASYDTSTGG